MANDTLHYLVIVELSGDSSMERLSQDVPSILRDMHRLSKVEPMLAFRSKDGLLFGLFILSDVAPAVLRAEFERSAGSRNGDHMMAFDIGDQHTGTSGFSRAWTWLQHH